MKTRDGGHTTQEVSSKRLLQVAAVARRMAMFRRVHRNKEPTKQVKTKHSTAQQGHQNKTNAIPLSARKIVRYMALQR